MTVTESGGKLLIHCQAGCEQSRLFDVLKELKLLDDQPKQQPSRGGGREPDMNYRYVTADGVLVAEHGRWNTAQGKRFAWRLAEGKWADGLGDVPIASLPLYGLADVLRHPDAAVYVVEGEKAASALRDRGLVAVCLGGGASQQMFGNALDPLLGRDVILWPDNDDPGRTFMARIASFLPDALIITPAVPEKGDAWDYFDGGGTVEALSALAKPSGPRVEIVGRDGVDVEMVSPHVLFEFRQMRIGRQEVQSVIRVHVKEPGYRKVPYSVRFNLESSSATDQLRRDLEKSYKGIDWNTVLPEARDLAKDEWRQHDRSIDLAEVAVPTFRRWSIADTIPFGVTTILFGQGGSGKSYLSLDIALHVLMGEPWMGRATDPVMSVLVIDYEDQADEWRLRANQICMAHGWEFPAEAFRYLPGMNIPIIDQIENIADLVTRHKVGLIIVDSAVSACKGSPREEEAPASVINPLNDLGVTTLLIAHNTKEDDERYPLGSIMWNNLARATQYIKAHQDEESPVLDFGLWNKKGNRGKKRPIGGRLVFDADTETGPVRIESTVAVPTSVLLDQQGSGVPDWQRIKAVLARANGKPMTVKDITDETGLPGASVRRELNDAKWAQNITPGATAGTWALRSDRDDAEMAR